MFYCHDLIIDAPDCFKHFSRATFSYFDVIFINFLEFFFAQIIPLAYETKEFLIFAFSRIYALGIFKTDEFITRIKVATLNIIFFKIDFELVELIYCFFIGFDVFDYDFGFLLLDGAFDLIFDDFDFSLVGSVNYLSFYSESVIVKLLLNLALLLYFFIISSDQMRRALSAALFFFTKLNLII